MIPQEKAFPFHHQAHCINKLPNISQGKDLPLLQSLVILARDSQDVRIIVYRCAICARAKHFRKLWCRSNPIGPGSGIELLGFRIFQFQVDSAASYQNRRT